MSQHRPFLTVHNLLFTILTITLPISKGVAAIQGRSTVPNVLDLVYGVLIVLSFFWLAEYKSRGDPRAEWYFEAHFLSVVLDVLHAIRSVVAKYIIRGATGNSQAILPLNGNQNTPGSIPLESLDANIRPPSRGYPQGRTSAAADQGDATSSSVAIGSQPRSNQQIKRQDVQRERRDDSAGPPQASGSQTRPTETLPPDPNMFYNNSEYRMNGGQYMNIGPEVMGQSNHDHEGDDNHEGASDVPGMATASMFHGSHHFDIKGGEFFNVGGSIIKIRRPKGERSPGS